MKTQRRPIGLQLPTTLCIVGSIIVTTGCRTLAAPMQLPAADRVAGQSADEADNPVVQVSAEQSLTEKTKKTGTQVMNFMTGREQENLNRARSLYQRADTLFRQAQSQPKVQAQETYRSAASLFATTRPNLVL